MTVMSRDGYVGYEESQHVTKQERDGTKRGTSHRSNHSAVIISPGRFRTFLQGGYSSLHEPWGCSPAQHAIEFQMANTTNDNKQLVFQCVCSFQ